MSQTRQPFDWLQFHLTLKRAGITRQRAAFQRSIGVLVEDVAREIVEISGSESYYDWMMTGSFVEGWGNHLFRLDGVTGTDSDIDWSQVVNHKIYHLKKTCKSIVDCINRKDYELDNGHIQVKNCSQQPAFATERHGLRPDTDECHAYPCCSYPETVPVNGQEIYPLFRKFLTEQFDNDDPKDDVHFVRASVPGQVNQMRLSCTRQERTIMSELSTVHGQLFTVLKYLFKTDDSERTDGAKKLKIIRHVKSFHAKTLLITMLRDNDSWLTQDEDQDEESAAQLLRKLVEKSLKSLGNSAATDSRLTESNESNGTGDTGGDESKDAEIPKVLDHALLRNASLYLKVKKEIKGKVSEKDVHKKALQELDEDLKQLSDNRKLETALSKYREQIERTLEKRGIPKVEDTPRGAETAEPVRGQPDGTEPAQAQDRFLFVPLLMLPRINLETLLEEMNRKNQKDTRSLDGELQSELDLEAPASTILKYAYIFVWRILTSLNEKNVSSKPEIWPPLQEAWEWVEKNKCLRTTYQCLKVMKMMKEKLSENLIFKVLEECHQPVRWISMSDDLGTVLREQNCVWAFHYFIRPNVAMSFDYLNSVQAAWKTAKTSVVYEMTEKEGEKKKHKREFVTEDGCHVRKSWLTHLEVKEDKKNSRQPSLTVNFDGLLDSFRRWMHMRNGSKCGELGGGEFLAFMDNCLFDPRTSE